MAHREKHVQLGINASPEMRATMQELPARTRIPQSVLFRESLDILRRRFAHDDVTEGYRKDGPVSVAKFEFGDGEDPDQREARVLRQREVSDLLSTS